MADKTLLDGAPVKMGGKTWLVPPLSFGQLRRLLPKISLLATVSAAMSDEQMDGVIEVVHAALSRNYPDITTEQLEDMLDLGNAQPLIMAVMGQSGLVSSGEVEAGSL